MDGLVGKSVLIRADAAPWIGTGHIMRSHVLASALKDAGAAVIFATRACEGNMIAFLKQQGYGVHEMSTDESWEYQQEDSLSWLGAKAADDVQECFQKNYDLVIVDHYGADKEWFKAAREYSDCILSIDDEAQRQMDFDIVLNQNFYPKGAALYQNKISTNCEVLIGPEYALLRSEFAQARNDTQIRNKLEKLLIIMGGNDTYCISERIVSALELPIHVTIVAGNAYNEDLQELCDKKGYTLLKRSNDIATLMKDADFCIGAGGSTSWERCCLKLPSALFILAENQTMIVDNLEKAGVCLNLGWAKDFDFSSINAVLESYIENPEKLQVMSEKAAALTDGLGVHRVLDVIKERLA